MEACCRILKQLGVELQSAEDADCFMSRTASSSLATRSSAEEKLTLPEEKIRSQARQMRCYAYPKEKSIRRFMDRVRQAHQTEVL